MHVFSNTAPSADGKIASARFDHVAIGSKTDLRYMSVLRARADAVLVGGRTFRNWPLPLVPDPTAIAELRASGFPDCEHPELEGRTWWTVVVTRTGEVPPFRRPDPRVKLLVLPEITVPGILERLAALGVESLLLEAGGDLVSQFVEADALDEMYLTVCPVVLGGRDAPTPLDGRGLPQPRRMVLLHANRVGDEVFCRYSLR